VWQRWLADADYRSPPLAQALDRASVQMSGDDIVQSLPV
jgi:hypothetical protein